MFKFINNTTNKIISINQSVNSKFFVSFKDKQSQNKFKIQKPFKQQIINQGQLYILQNNNENLLNFSKSFVNSQVYCFSSNPNKKKSKKGKKKGQQQQFKKEVLDYSKPDEFNFDKHQQQRLQDENVKCLVIHPVFHPNKGPEIELYLAEEAIGLTKSLGWGVAKGPFWQDEFTEEIKQQLHDVVSAQERKKQEDDLLNEVIENNYSPEKYQELRKKRFGIEDQEEKDSDLVKIEGEDEWKSLKDQSEIKDGDYIYTPAFSGVYEKKGIIIDLSSTDDSDGGDLFNEWNNQLVRSSIAKSSLMKVRKINSKNFLTRGKIHQLGVFIKENDINALFVNAELTTLQNRNLEKLLVEIINGQEDEKFFTKSSQMYKSQQVESSDSELSDSAVSPEHHQNYMEGFERKLKVFDRFTIILQIFAKRAKTQVAKLQIELTFLNFLRSKLMREGGNTFSYMYNIFQGDLMQAENIKLEVVSAKQKSSKGVMSGSGETQLELQRRLISDKQAELMKKLQSIQKTTDLSRRKKQIQLNSIPVIALIGYTNAGKSALMNQIIKGDVVESKDLLFQTLNTTSRKIRLVSGQQAILLDTIGFISNLPHDLIGSFKSTLQECEFADLVLHIRDISHPQTEEQKKTVLKVLKQLNFDQDFYTQKMVEVWNKIDLIKEQINYDDANVQDYPIIPISAKYNTNLDKLLTVIEDKANFIKNKKQYTLEHGVDQHGERTRWLFQNANITQVTSEQYDYNNITDNSPFGTVKVQVTLDDITYRRYQIQFGIVEKEDIKPKKGLPPKNW